MARKILVDSSDTIDGWRQKVNQMSGYVEDLDDLDTTFQPGNTWALGYPIDRDSNIVSATNYLISETNDIFNTMIAGTAVSTRTATVKIYADSAVFNTLHANQLWNYDAAMTLGPVDSTWFGDSPGTSDFDFTAESASFGILNVINLRETPDSATFGRLTILDSGFIGSIKSLDSTSTVIFKNLTARGQDITIDSALVLNIIRIGQFISDSGSDSGVNITKATIGTADINSLTMTDSPAITFLHARPFLVTDSLGYDSAFQGDSGQIYFAAIQLDIDSV